MTKHAVLCSHCQRDTCVLDDEEEFIINGISYLKVPPGVYEVPVNALGGFSAGQIPPHSSIRIIDLPPPPPDLEFYLRATNAGDPGEDQYLTIFAEVYLTSDENRQARLARIRRAFEQGKALGEFIPPGARDHRKLGGSFKLDLAGQPTSIISDQVQPVLEAFRLINGS